MLRTRAGPEFDGNIRKLFSTVSNAGLVEINGAIFIGATTANTGSSNTVFITGAGSAMTNSSTVSIGAGSSGSGHGLVVSNGGKFVTTGPTESTGVPLAAKAEKEFLTKPSN